VFEPPRARRKRRWFLWVVAGLLVVMFCNRDRSKQRAREAAAVPSPAAEADSVDADARAARDGTIKTAVERALRSNPRTRRQDIDVEVEEGIVSLSGHAPAAAARDAETMARHVSGVREVLNTIEAEEEDAAHGAGPHGPPDGDFRLPTPPVPPRGGPPPNAENLRDLLREGKAALKAGDPGEALGKFGAALGIDPSNEEARQGMKDATLLLGETIRRHVEGKPSPEP
jgi:hypothetical protein